MPETGTQAPAPPASYRLTLALSLALMAHTVLLAGLPSPLQETRDTSHRLILQLASATSEPADPSLPANREHQTLRHPQFDVAPAPEQVTTTAPTPPKAAKPETAPRPEPEPLPSTQAIPSAPSPGEATATKDIQQVSESPAELDPYRVKLATHLAEKLERRRVPAISQLGASVTMELELRLLPNGALTRARVLKSTGVQSIDDAAYRAALSASPYPEPKGEESDRFEVKLVFTPKRS